MHPMHRVLHFSQMYRVWNQFLQRTSYCFYTTIGLGWHLQYLSLPFFEKYSDEMRCNKKMHVFHMEDTDIADKEIHAVYF